MSRHRFYYKNINFIDDTLRNAIDCSRKLQALERELVQRLRFINEERFFESKGHKSLGSYCRDTLFLSPTDIRRVVAQVHYSKCAAKTTQSTQLPLAVMNNKFKS